MASAHYLFRQSIDSMIDLRHPLAVLATRMPSAQIESALAPKFAHHDRAGVLALRVDMLGPTLALSGAGRARPACQQFRGRRQHPRDERADT